MLGNNIKELRKSKRMTQRDLAVAMRVSQQTVGAWETGRAIPGSDTLGELADYFNVTTDYLLGVLCLKKTLVRLNVANVESFAYTENTMLDV